MKDIKVSVGSVVGNCEFCLAMFKIYDIKFAIKYHEKYHASHLKLEQGKIKVKTFQSHCNKLVYQIQADIANERYKNKIKKDSSFLNNVKVVVINPNEKK